MGGGLGHNPEEQSPLEAVPPAAARTGRGSCTVAVGCRGELLARSSAGVALRPSAPHRLSRSPPPVLALRSARGGGFAVCVRETEGRPLPPQHRLRRLPGLCCPLPWVSVLFGKRPDFWWFRRKASPCRKAPWGCAGVLLSSFLCSPSSCPRPQLRPGVSAQRLRGQASSQGGGRGRFSTRAWPRCVTLSYPVALSYSSWLQTQSLEQPRRTLTGDTSSQKWPACGPGTQEVVSLEGLHPAWSQVSSLGGTPEPFLLAIVLWLDWFSLETMWSVGDQHAARLLGQMTLSLNELPFGGTPSKSVGTVGVLSARLPAPPPSSPPKPSESGGPRPHQDFSCPSAYIPWRGRGGREGDWRSELGGVWGEGTRPTTDLGRSVYHTPF